MSQSNPARKEDPPADEHVEAPATLRIRKRSFGEWLRASIPTAIIIALLVGIGTWGKTTGWKLPKFSRLAGASEEAKEDWCEEHNVPESQCIECNKELLHASADYGWCEEHGVAQCPFEHPDVAQTSTPPTITPAVFERAKRALTLLPREENNKTCKMYQKRIQIASQEALDKAGITTAVAAEEPVIEAVAANGQVQYDETRTAHLASRVPGSIWRVEKRVGDQVHVGDILALVESAEVGRLKSELLQAISQTQVGQTNVDRLQQLAKDGAVAGKSLREAEAILHESQIKLLSAEQALVNLGLPINVEALMTLSVRDVAKQIKFLGLPAELTTKFNPESTTSNLFPLRSPLDGVVVDTKSVAGETVDVATTVFEVTDLRHMWLVLNVRQDDAERLSLNQPVLFRPHNRASGAEITGKIAWISTEADDKTRTVKVRVDLPNDDATLRANTFGIGRIVLREEEKAVTIPTEAIHSDGDCRVVFVRDKNFTTEGAPKFFHVREVRVGAKNGDASEIIAGVLPGEVVADKNSAVLEAQLLKGNMVDED